MRGIALFSLGFLGLLAAQEQATAAPSQLYGKSVVVSWSEERLQKVNGESSPRSVTRFGQFSVYISSTGKPFSRMSYSFAGRNSARSGNRDSVGGEGRGNRNVSFSGNTMNVVMTMGGGARLLAQIRQGIVLAENSDDRATLAGLRDEGRRNAGDIARDAEALALEKRDLLFGRAVLLEGEFRHSPDPVAEGDVVGAALVHVTRDHVEAKAVVLHVGPSVE